SLNGQIIANAGVPLPARLRVYLVPAEREHADDVLRFAEAPVLEGKFALGNLAPGRYWLMARPITEDEIKTAMMRPRAWDSEARAKLRREAEATQVTIDLQPCQRLS